MVCISRRNAQTLLRCMLSLSLLLEFGPATQDAVVLQGRAPDPFVGPSEWQPSVGDCIVYEDATYEYKLCLFHNITQTKKYNANEAYLLGVWGGWVGDAYTKMKFKDGTECSSDVLRSTTVEVSSRFEPIPMTSSKDEASTGSNPDSAAALAPQSTISEVSEPSPCEYVIKLEYVFPEVVAAVPEPTNGDDAFGGEDGVNSEDASAAGALSLIHI